MQTIKAGKQFRDFVRLCYTAGCPCLIHGRHGVGKSEQFAQAAAELGVGCVVIDLSPMDSPDLMGLPQAKDDVTCYLPPRLLPRDGRGLLVFEELNRCGPHVRVPCLQLLTARRINEYVLPAGWLPVAAINPADEDYEVDPLDPALLSRFVCVELVPDRMEWLVWANRNQVHPAVLEYVKAESRIFDDPESNPRSWKVVSNLVTAAEELRLPRTILGAAVSGAVGDTRGAAFLKTYRLHPEERVLTATHILDAFPSHRTRITKWIREDRLDLVGNLLLDVQIYLQPREDYEQVRKSRRQWGNFRGFLAVLPDRLQQKAVDYLRERNYTIPRGIGNGKSGGR